MRERTAWTHKMRREPPDPAWWTPAEPQSLWLYSPWQHNSFSLFEQEDLLCLKKTLRICRPFYFWPHSSGAGLDWVWGCFCAQGSSYPGDLCPRRWENTTNFSKHLKRYEETDVHREILLIFAELKLKLEGFPLITKGTPSGFWMQMQHFKLGTSSDLLKWFTRQKSETQSSQLPLNAPRQQKK